MVLAGPTPDYSISS